MSAPGKVHHLVEPSREQVPGHEGPQNLLADHLGGRLPLSGHGDMLIFGRRRVDSQHAETAVCGVPDTLLGRGLFRIRVPRPAGLGPRVETHVPDLLGMEPATYPGG
jgi:hypothetical protein